MEKVVYNEDTIFNPPVGASFYDHIQGLRDELDRMELERDRAIAMLIEVIEADSEGDLEEAVSRVKSFVENISYPESF